MHALVKCNVRMKCLSTVLPPSGKLIPIIMKVHVNGHVLSAVGVYSR